MTGREMLDLPEPWGRSEFMYSPHSEQLTVPLADGIREKGIREFTWKLHSAASRARGLGRPGQGRLR